MDSQWTSQPHNYPYYMPSASQDAYPMDLVNLFPFDDSIFPLPDSTSVLVNSLDMNRNTHRPPQLDSPFAMIESSNSVTTPELDPPDSVSSALAFEACEQDSPLSPWLLNPATGEVTLSSERDNSKRTRTDVDDDIAACWKSPLCPNKMLDGDRPESCKGECAGHLFAHPSEIPDDRKILAELWAKSEPKISLEPSSRKGKRQEMEDSPDVTGRLLPPTTKRPVQGKLASASLQSESPSSSSSPPPPPLSPPSSAAAAASKPKVRVPHNQVEKKYRENVNAQLEALRRVVPVSKQQLVGFDGFDIEDLTTSARQPSKAVVLSSATAYIRHLEKENKQLMDEMEALKTQNKTLQSLVKCDDCSLMNYVRRWKIQPPG